MAAELGWIKLYRQIMSGWLWNSNEPFDHRSAWIDMLLCANHEGKKACIDGQLIDIERGSFVTSQLKLAERWKWDRKKVKRFLDLLEQDGMVSVNSTTRRTTVTIENYDKYQDCGTSPATGITPSPTPSSGQDLPQVLPTNKNDKNIKNDKNDKNICSFDAFWEVYPRKVAKAKARKSWDKLSPDDELLGQIISALEQQKQSRDWIKDNGQFIPYPTTWLNQRRWEDELPERIENGSNKQDAQADAKKRWNLPE
jgi:DNA replication protein DnaD